MSLNNETLTGQDTLVAIENSIKEVKQVLINRGDNGAEKCLEGCVGLVYSLIERDQASLFRYLFLLHGHKFLDEPVAGRFQDHYMVVGEDQQGKWFATSPANFDIQDLIGGEILQAISPEDLYRQIQRQMGGNWVHPGRIFTDLERYQSPKVVSGRGQFKLEVIVGEWDPESSGFITVVHPCTNYGHLKKGIIAP